MPEICLGGTSPPLCQLHSAEDGLEQDCVEVPAAIVERVLDVAQHSAAVVAGDHLLCLVTAIDTRAAGPI